MLYYHFVLYLHLFILQNVPYRTKCSTIFDNYGLFCSFFTFIRNSIDVACSGNTSRSLIWVNSCKKKTTEKHSHAIRFVLICVTNEKKCLNSSRVENMSSFDWCLKFNFFFQLAKKFAIKFYLIMLNIIMIWNILWVFRKKY